MSALSEITSKPVAIIGGGVTGNALINFFRGESCEIELFDDVEQEIDGVISMQQLDNPSHFGTAVISPGWRRTHPLIEQFENAGVRILSEIDLAWLVRSERMPKQKWLGITGTNGKTTTVQMLESILAESTFSGVACGHVGSPAISAVTSAERYDILAVELSSFQINWSELPSFEAIAILNIAQDHLDWHGSFDEYAQTKMSLANLARCAILNAQDQEIVGRSHSLQCQKVFYSLETPAPGEIGLVEEIIVDRAFVENVSKAEPIAELSDIKPTIPHNVSNAMAAAALALAAGITHAEVKAGLAAFKLDHHRQELVLEKSGITWVNDSKATNPHAAIAGILAHNSVIWIAGGLAKGASMDDLVKRAAPRLTEVLLIGKDREIIASALDAYAPTVAYKRIDGSGTAESLMSEVITHALTAAKSGDTVLLAPACASMDQFDSYAHRGDLFTAKVLELVK